MSLVKPKLTVRSCKLALIQTFLSMKYPGGFDGRFTFGKCTVQVKNN